MSKDPIDYRSDTWQLGFNSAVAGWANIPPAGVDPHLWMAGWQAGRNARQEAHRQYSDAWQAFCVQRRVPVILPERRR
ncbi:MAG: hypothetical protein FJ189_07045 [Gammaproteobacteria bacterium]|nr:hypothetical protein [Gammaproteobacteria bacterium]